eukprot:Hpha_TRINITY_DN15714_c0_g9::TRINITY_DN15714_c0_g9_i1::g.36481::m.36481
MEGDYGAMDAESSRGRQRPEDLLIGQSLCARVSQRIRGCIAGCLRCCCGEDLARFVTADDVDMLDADYQGKEGSPLWAYFRFQDMLTTFWWQVTFLQLLNYVWVFYRGLWMGVGATHEEVVEGVVGAPVDAASDYSGGSAALFIGAWKDGDSYLKWIWYVTNCICVGLAIYLPVQVRRLADWQETHPSIRHLLNTGCVKVTLVDEADDHTSGMEDIFERRKAIETILRKQGSVPCSLRCRVKDAPKRNDVFVQIDQEPLQQIGGVLEQLNEHSVRAEVLTYDRMNYLETFNAMHQEGSARASIKDRGGSLEDLLGVTLSESLTVVKIDKEGPSARVVGKTADGEATDGDLKTSCTLDKLLYTRAGEEEAISVTTKRKAEQALAALRHDEEADFVGVEYTGLNDISLGCCRVKRTSCKHAGEILQQFANIFLFIFMTLASGAVVRYLTNEKKVEKDTKTLIMVSLALVLTKIIFEKVSGVLGGSAFGNDPEQRETASLVQRLWFKVVILLVVLWMLAPQSGRCPENVLGGTLIIYMITDYLVGWLMQFLIPPLLNLIAYIKGGGPRERACLEIHEEYLDVIYNQFVLYLTMPIFPGAALLGLIFNKIEGRIDKWKIQSRFVLEPDSHNSDVTTQINSVQACLVALVFLAAVAPRIGVFFVLNGEAVREGHSGHCFFPDWHASDSVATNSSFFSFNWVPGMTSLEQSVASHWHHGTPTPP